MQIENRATLILILFTLSSHRWCLKPLAAFFIFGFDHAKLQIVHMDGTSMEIVTSQIRNLDYVLILHAVRFYLVGQSG